MYKASYIYGSILCIAPPILHKMVPIYRVSYILLWVHLMYTNYCGGLTPVHKMVPIVT